MPVPLGIKWSRDPHTEAKHHLLEGYLNAWFPILASTNQSRGVTYVDAFAASGEYDDGSSGSPIIALRSALRASAQCSETEFRFIFSEKHRGRSRYLEELVARNKYPKNYAIKVLHGECEIVLIPELDLRQVWRGPLFANFDGWGVDTPYMMIKEMKRAPSSEVLVTFHSQWFTRFANNEELAAGDLVFGNKTWRQVGQLTSPFEKKKFLVDEYRRRLTAAGFPLHLTFELVDEGGHPLFLVFGTTSKLGIEKMKDAMWRVDRISGSRFRDPRDPNQLTFDLSDRSPNLTLLREQILEYLDDAEKSLTEIQEFVLLETVFKKVHARAAVDELEVSKKVKCVHARAYDDFLVKRAPASLF